VRVKVLCDSFRQANLLKLFENRFELPLAACESGLQHCGQFEPVT
jgi:hypothetical protein